MILKKQQSENKRMWLAVDPEDKKIVYASASEKKIIALIIARSIENKFIDTVKELV